MAVPSGRAVRSRQRRTFGDEFFRSPKVLATSGGDLSCDFVEGGVGNLIGANLWGSPATDYTARVIPHYSGVAVPLEAAHILWQR